MGLLGKLFSNEGGNIITSVGNVLDNIITTKEEKINLENELKKAEMQHEYDMQKLSLDEKKAYLDDVDSARKREATVQTSEHATMLSKNISPILALGTIVLTFTLFYIIIFRRNMIEEGVKDIIMYILGVLSAIATQVYSFYFGSSQGSADKNNILNNRLKKM